MGATLVWDEVGSHWFETGVSKGVLYPMSKDSNGKPKYDKGVVWNGLTSVSESPDGADATDLWADNIKYASLRATETFGGTIEAYTYPDEWADIDGSARLGVSTSGIMGGVSIGQQPRKSFGLCYRTEFGNDVDSNAGDESDGYKIHLIYNCTASPSERSYESINDSPDAITFSWEYTSNPVSFTNADALKAGLKPVSCITIDTRKISDTKRKILEAMLYGSDGNDGEGITAGEPKLPTPDEIYTWATA